MLFLRPGIAVSHGRRRPQVMKSVTVYRIDVAKKTRVPVGTVVDRRKKDRGDGLVGLLRVARKTYSSSARDAIQIAIDPIRMK